MKVLTVILILAGFNLNSYSQTIADIDGNVYNTVTIGEQVWMKENLKTTRFNDGSKILNTTDSADWNNETEPAYCWYNNDSVQYGTVYGAMYNGYTALEENVCPTGWQIPTRQEVEELLEYLGIDPGGKLKMTGTEYWNMDNIGATNSSGFSALPGGFRRSAGFLNEGDVINFWTQSLTEDETRVESFYVQADVTYSLFSGGKYSYGQYIRCIKGKSTTSNGWIAIENKTIYPNPASNEIYVNTEKGLDARIMIFDIQGKILINELFDENSIDISILKSGIYTVKIINCNSQFTEKLIKR